MESRFNSLVEDFQRYINVKEQEISEKDAALKKQSESRNMEQYNPIMVDNEERETALKLYNEIIDDFKIPQERDEVMLDTIEKYIYDKKQPNVAYGIWEHSDFTHCNNIEKSYKLMRALLQDCYIPGRKNESEMDKNSFSFKESQLKESFEKEKKLRDQQCEELKMNLQAKNHEILELKDVIRARNQEYELLRQQIKDEDEKSDNKHTVRSNGSASPSRLSQDQPIQPYGTHKKEVDELQQMVCDLQEENEFLRSKMGNSETRKSQFNFDTRPDNDGTVVIGGVSNMGLNLTDENDVSVKNCKIEMSPIETRDRDNSAVDDGLLGVFDRSASRGGSRTTKRQINFDEHDPTEKENFRGSTHEMDHMRSNKETVYSNHNQQVEYLRQEVEEKQQMIYDLTSKLDFYMRNAKNKDLSSPRFMEPEYMRNERTRNQRMTAEKVFKEILNIFDNTHRLYDAYFEKFNKLIHRHEADRLEFEQLSHNESKQIENLSKDDDLQLLKVLNSLTSLGNKASNNLSKLLRVIMTTDDPNQLSDSQIEQDKRMLHVKSDHELFLIKDLTQEVTKIIDYSKDTKEQFERLYSAMDPNQKKNKDIRSFEQSNYSSNRDENMNIVKLGQLMGDMDGYIQHLEQIFHELIDRSATIIDNSDLIEKNYIKLLKISNGKGDQQQKISEMHTLNEENLRTILKLRKELI